MLPDFPQLKRDLDHVLQQHIRAKVHEADPVLQHTSRTIQHEGESREIIRPSGQVDPFNYEQLQGAIEIPNKEFARLTLPELFAHMERSAITLASQMAQLAYRRIGESCDQVGTSTDFGGRAISFDVLLEGLSKLQIDFDGAEDRPIMPMMVVTPELGARLQELIPQWDSDPECNRRMRELLRSKYEEWRDRQDRKQLVD